MKVGLRCGLGLAGLVISVGTLSFAQASGEAIYKQRCFSCHGVGGLANSGVGKIMKVKPVTDSDVRKMSEAEMIDVVRKGGGRMESYKDSLTESQIRATVEYFRSFMK
jgi:mono/diheme cytochrome c family protein